MNDIMNFFQDNPVVGLTGWLATMISVVLAVWFFLIQRKKKILSFTYQTNELFNNKVSNIEELNISYKGKNINNLSVTSFEFANTGNGVIKKEHIYENHGIEISPIDEVDLLFAKVMSQSTDTINCKAPEIVNGKICVNFAALEEKEKFVINIYHAGSNANKFQVAGKIEEGKIIEGRIGRLSLILQKITGAIYFFYIIPVVIGLLCGLAISVYTYNEANNVRNHVYARLSPVIIRDDGIRSNETLDVFNEMINKRNTRIVQLEEEINERDKRIEEQEAEIKQQKEWLYRIREICRNTRLGDNELNSELESELLALDAYLEMQEKQSGVNESMAESENDREPDNYEDGELASDSEAGGE